MLFPLVLITSREAMKSVPDEYRDASAATRRFKVRETIRSVVVVPASMPGVITGVILGVGRIAGETAPVARPERAELPDQVTRYPLQFHGSGQPPAAVRPRLNPALLERASARPISCTRSSPLASAPKSPSAGDGARLARRRLAFFAMGIASRRYFREETTQ